MAAKAVARGRPPGKPGTPPPIHAADIDGAEPPEIIRLTAIDDETRIPLFSIGDTEYTILARPQMEIGLHYLKLSQTGTEQAATYYLLTTLLGDDGYDALMGFKGLQQAQFNQVVQIATTVALGTLETPKE